MLGFYSSRTKTSLFNRNNNKQNYVYNIKIRTLEIFIWSSPRNVKLFLPVGGTLSQAELRPFTCCLWLSSFTKYRPRHGIISWIPFPYFYFKMVSGTWRRQSYRLFITSGRPCLARGSYNYFYKISYTWIKFHILKCYNNWSIISCDVMICCDVMVLMPYYWMLYNMIFCDVMVLMPYHGMLYNMIFVMWWFLMSYHVMSCDAMLYDDLWGHFLKYCDVMFCYVLWCLVMSFHKMLWNETSCIAMSGLSLVLVSSSTNVLESMWTSGFWKLNIHPHKHVQIPEDQNYSIMINRK